MKFITAASLFAAALAAPVAQTEDCPNPAHCGAPSPTVFENINIDDFFLRKDDSGIRSVDFKLSGDNATSIVCKISATKIPSEQTHCGDEFDNPYSFKLIAPRDEDPKRDVDVTIFHQTGQVSGLLGNGTVPTYCHAGGDGASDMVCNQVGKVTIVITPWWA